MENQYQQPSSIFPQQEELPNATPILVLGIISIVGCFCWGAPGLICGIISLVLANRALKLYNDNPSIYLPSSYSNVKAGKICAIIGLCISILCIVFLTIYFIFIGTIISSTDWYRHSH